MAVATKAFRGIRNEIGRCHPPPLYASSAPLNQGRTTYVYESISSINLVISHRDSSPRRAAVTDESVTLLFCCPCC